MPVALKIIRNKKRFHHQALVEVKILEHLMGRDKEHKSNIVRVHGYFYFRNHLCVTFEPLSIKCVHGHTRTLRKSRAADLRAGREACAAELRGRLWA